MNSEVFAEWLRRQGHRVIRTENSYWFNQGPRVYQAFPYHWMIRPSDEELRSLLCDNYIIGARYSAPVDHQEGSISYHTICDDKGYSLMSVDGSSRSQVRRGLESCTVKPISLEQYAEEGWGIQQDTVSRQGRSISNLNESWRDMVLSAVGLEGFEVWGAIVKDRLAATVFFVQLDDCINLLFQQSLREYLPFKVNNALSFMVTQELINRPSVKLLHYGLHSLDAPASVDKFKLSMGYSIRPVRQRIILHPAIPRVIIPSANMILKGSSKLFPKNNTLCKTEGLLRFYTNGLLPIADQQLPELLVKRKEELIQMGISRKQESLNTNRPYQDGAVNKGTDIQIRFATLADIETLTDLHCSLFSPEEHIAMILGRKYIKAMHRWQVTSNVAYSLIAEVNGQAVGFQGVSDVPYTWPMFIYCLGAFVVCILQKPSYLFEKRLWERFLRHERSRGLVKINRDRFIQLGVAQLIVGGVDSRYRGKGIFHSLIESVKKISRERGSNAFVTGVYKNNTPGRKVFIKYGWLDSPVLETSETIFYATLFDSPFADEIINLLKLKTNHNDALKDRQ